jgi:RNA polymerase sigma factor for flagellar operon FliA
MSAMQERAGNEQRVAALWSAFATSRDPDLRNRLIVFYQPLAKQLAIRTYVLRRDDSVSFADYLQYAHVGLVESVDRFDPRRAVLFETFATYRIRGAILNGLAKESELAAQRGYWAERMRERTQSLKHATVTDGEVDEALKGFVGVTVGLALGLLLEQPVEPADESAGANPYAATALAQAAGRVRQLVGRLPERERTLVELHYFRHEAFQDIAARFGISKGRVSQLHAQALKRLRKLLGQEAVVDGEI